MKNIILALLLMISSQIYAQESKVLKPFSAFKFGVLGGSNFNTIPTLGGAFQIEAKTNITSSLFAKISFGYSSTFENNEYEIKTYHVSNIGGVEGYQTYSYKVDKIEYSIFPINLGLEYILLGDIISPFAVFEVGYNIISSEEQVVTSGSGTVYNSIGEIPIEYKTPMHSLTEGEYLGIGIGLGVIYKITSSLDLSIRYVYRYNDSIINSNYILLGVSF